MSHLVYTDHVGLGKNGAHVTTVTGGPHGFVKGDILTSYGERWLIDPVNATTLTIYRATWWRRLGWWFERMYLRWRATP